MKHFGFNFDCWKKTSLTLRARSSDSGAIVIGLWVLELGLGLSGSEAL